MYAENLAMGPVFRVPITMIVPETVSDVDFSVDHTFNNVTTIPIRQFIHVPAEATICRKQLEDDKCYRNSESYKILGPDSHEWTRSFPVIGDRTLEVCLVRSWTRSDVEGSVRVFTRFYGVQRNPNINLIHGCPYTPIRYTYKVDKGEYTAQVQVRHPETSQLELLMDTPLLVPKIVSVVGGCFLTGNLVVMSDSELKQADKTAVTYLFTEYSTRPNAIRDTQIAWLLKLKDPVAVDRLYSELIAKYPTHLPLLLTKMKLLVDKKVLRIIFL
ncbi:unnamed protein product [Strongylus vulgaris]|uniref:Tripeptidyl peptidase II C-terminal domain-containing protein n=1 Tax=Strongylus vulgaris TaxID=40348 RepID=A0A3P7J9Z6_STRVU|nr:unnamed protein product [Strongylus vulgaris]